MKTKVLVTGANGHLGYHVVIELLNAGHDVRVSVRNKNDQHKVSKFKNLDIEIVEADLLSQESLVLAMKGVDAIFQIAAGYKMDTPDKEKAIWDTAIVGTKNIFNAAKINNIKKIIYTSSVAAVGMAHDGIIRDENYWNDHADEYYAKAKTASEKLAWELSREYQIDLITILPGMIIGPGFNTHTPSTYLFYKILKNKIPMILDGELGMVDVRDVALMHVKAYETKTASGRYIISGNGIKFIDLMKIANKYFPEIRVPNTFVPKWMIPFLPLMDYLEAKFTGSMRTLTRGSVKEYLSGGEQLFSYEKAKKELGFNPRPVENTIQDVLAWIKENELELKNG